MRLISVKATRPCWSEKCFVKRLCADSPISGLCAERQSNLERCQIRWRCSFANPRVSAWEADLVHVLGTCSLAGTIFHSPSVSFQQGVTGWPLYPSTLGAIYMLYLCLAQPVDSTFFFFTFLLWVLSIHSSSALLHPGVAMSRYPLHHGLSTVISQIGAFTCLWFLYQVCQV